MAIVLPRAQVRRPKELIEGNIIALISACLGCIVKQGQDPYVL